MARKRCAFLGCLLALSAGVSATAQGVRSFWFDNGATTDAGLTWSFERASPSIDIDGAVVPAGSARFATRTLLCGAPSVTTVAGTTNPVMGIHTYAGGVLADNTTPAWIIYNTTQGKFEVHTGSVGGAVYSCNVVGSAAKGNTPDLLKESVDANANEAWTPRSATICHGFAVVLCNVSTKNSSGVWQLNRIGIAVCNLANLPGAKSLWWRRHALSDRLSERSDNNYMYGAGWALSGWWVRERNGEPPTEFWIAAADYRAFPSKDGGLYFVMPVRRSGATASDWVANKVYELPGRFSRPNQNVTHAHAAGLCAYGAAGLLVLAARGDSLFNNCNYTWTIDDATNYRAGAAARADSYEWYAGGPGWSGPKLVHGFVGNPDDPVQLRRSGNQWIGIAPGPTDRTFVVGLDEVHQPMALTPDMSGDPDELDYRSAYGITRTMVVPTHTDGSAVPGRFLSFHVQASRANGTDTEYVAQLSPSQLDPERVLNQRVLFSPDGENWGQMWAHRENEQTRAVIAGGKVWVGSAGQNLGLGVRSTPLPATRLARPLVIEPGGTNLVSAFASAGDPAPGVTVVPVTLPDGASGKPPANGPAFLFINAPASNTTAVSYLGSIVLAPSVPTGTSTMTFRVWVRNLPAAEQGVAGSLSLKLRLRSTDMNGTFGSTRVSGYAPQIEIPSSGDWVPITLTTNVEAWGGQATKPWIELLVSTGSFANPCAFHLVLESVNQGSTLMFPGDAGVSGAGERTSLEFEPSATGDFTALVAAMEPWNSWGTFSIELEDRPLFSLVSQDGTRAAVVTADPTNKTLRLRSWVDGQYEAHNVASIANIYWMQGSPILCGLTYQASTGVVRLRGSVGGNEIGGAQIVAPGLGTTDRLMFSDPMGKVVTPLYVFGGKIDSTAWDTGTVDAALRSLDMIPKGTCPGDFNRDGFVNGNDYDLFAEAFDAGDAAADVDGDGYVNGDDYDAFAASFDAGC
ncbi:MAG: hypothetical protein HUU19_07095 [Phycisphaerales bacterium]|nr:hypothetical protein [Phycisphaerales bacterium]